MAAGVTPATVSEIVVKAGVDEVHSAASTSRKSGMTYMRSDAKMGHGDDFYLNVVDGELVRGIKSRDRRFVIQRIDEASMTTKKATHQLTKQHNRDLVLRTIFAHDSISRAEVARVTRLTRTTVSEVVNNLLAEGLVEEVGRGESIGGKSPILLSIVADSRYLIGLKSCPG